MSVGGSDGAGRSSNQRAYELYLDGKFQRSRRDVNGTPASIASLEAALREDPYFAEAWAALAETYDGAGITQSMPVDEAFKQARTAALGQIDEACAALRHAPDDHSQTLGWLRLDPRMDPLRKEPCYAEVSQRLFKQEL